MDGDGLEYYEVAAYTTSMIKFVNAKINIGLQIVRRREDGYHDLQTVFYPVGLHAGTPCNPEPFCDIIEIVPVDKEGVEFEFTGRQVDCPQEKNLVCRAARLFWESKGKILQRSVCANGIRVCLDKHLPDGAGMGGGSADASFTITSLNSLLKEEDRMTDDEMAAMALSLGADCPFFVYNRPMYGEGVGEVLSDIALDLSGYWFLIVKPRVYVSTKDAFAGIIPKKGDVDLRRIAEIPIVEWQGMVKNDFEDSIFPKYPELAEIKRRLLERGAVYASMSGSGSSIYGIFSTLSRAESARSQFVKETTIEGIYLLEG